MSLQNRLKRLVEWFPLLSRPAYAAWVAMMKTRSRIFDISVRQLGYLPRSLSDRGQDRWVSREIFAGKAKGFFLDLGAADGFSESNTYVLEKRYGWDGICIEPNPVLFDALVNKYKRSCRCVPLAVDSVAGSVEFMLEGQLSGLITDESDHTTERRSKLLTTARAEGRIVKVATLPLDAILARYNAPPVIDYFSFDVEGLETRILRSFPFDKYTFLSMTIERPTPELNSILFRNGYHFVRNALYDTFYVHESIPNFRAIRREPFEQLPPKAF